MGVLPAGRRPAALLRVAACSLFIYAGMSCLCRKSYDVEIIKRLDLRNGLSATLSPMMKKPVVIVADDEEAIRLIVTRVLGSLGCEVLCARDGQEALELASDRSGAITLLITDVEMPRLCGTDLCERVVRSWPGTDVILMTGDSQRIGERYAALPLLLKPFTISELTALVREALAPGRHDGQAVALADRCLAPASHHLESGITA